MQVKTISFLFILCLSINASAQFNLTNLDSDMVLVRGGNYVMGSTKGKADEQPLHTIKLNTFSISKYEVTQALWLQVMGSGTGVITDCPACAVYNLKFKDIQLFLNKLNQLTGRNYRLPTEAEWEYAATGGDKSRGYKYSGSDSLDEVSWYAPNAGMKTHPVGLKKPNELGLYDMSGNVWELCSDWYKKDFYKHSANDNPIQSKKTLWRVVRGGSWRSEEQRCQTHARNIDVHDHHISNQGIRLVRDETNNVFSSWVDSMADYAINCYLPATKYKWNWQNAALLNAVVKEYEYALPNEKQRYYDYIKEAMDKSGNMANGRMPNAVASGLGMAFLYNITRDEKYKLKCDKIFHDYLHSKRTTEGAVSHVPVFAELWDDTVFMIGEFLIAMYRATNDEKYLDELAKQIALHREKLQVKEWGLWVHGWDQSDWGHCLFCSQVHWSDKITHRSPEIWGRGNGWILVTLSDALETIPKTNPHFTEFANDLKEMVLRLPELQDKKTGHWYQLPVRNNDPGNFIESSCTAMFAYGIDAALHLGLVSDSSYSNSVALAYRGLRNYSVVPIADGYLTTKNICKATCIGNKNYYFHRGVQQGKAYGLASFIQFGLSYETEKGWRAEGTK